MKIPVNKEDYIKQVEQISIYLKGKAKDIFSDINENISNVNIQINIQPAEMASIEISKKYYPETIGSNKTILDMDTDKILHEVRKEIEQYNEWKKELE